MKTMSVKSIFQSKWPIYRSPHVQTILSHYLPNGEDLAPQEQHIVSLEDQDQIVLAENIPSQLSTQKIVLFVHGLGGCYQSSYLVRLNRRFTELGYRCFRMNMRGCGPGWDKAKSPPNAGRSDDLRQVLEFIRRKHPFNPVTVIGFSMGANILLKMLGEDGHARSGQIEDFIAVSPPLDLQRSVQCLKKTENQVYSYFFTHLLKKNIRQIQKAIPELREYKVDHCRELPELDEAFTAPACGYQSARDYYEDASSLPLLSKIKIPGHIIGAYDDPIIDGSIYRELSPHPNIQYSFSEKGGHVAFLSSPLSKKFRWMDEKIVQLMVGSGK